MWICLSARPSLAHLPVQDDVEGTYREMEAKMKYDLSPDEEKKLRRELAKELSEGTAGSQAPREGGARPEGRERLTSCMHVSMSRGVGVGVGAEDGSVRQFLQERMELFRLSVRAFLEGREGGRGGDYHQHSHLRGLAA